MLKFWNSTIGIELDYVENRASVQADSVLVSDDDFAGFNAADCQGVTMDCFDSRSDLHHIGPHDLLVGSLAVTISSCGGKVLFDECLRKGVIIEDEDERAIAECTSGESVDDGDNAPIDDVLPVLNRSYGTFVAQAETCRSKQWYNMADLTHTFKTAQDIVVTILGRLCLVNPAWKTEDSGALVVICVQRNQAMVMLNVGRKCAWKH